MKDKSLHRRKIGLALGGGGWRGIAHIGVLKVLERHNIQIDFVAGTSVGSLVGGLYCFLGNSTDLESFLLRFGYKDLFRIMADPKLKAGLLKGKKFIDYINKVTEGVNIEDLKIPFTAVSSNLLSGQPFYIKEGNLADAIKASISIPLVFEPSKKDGTYLVDGGITENLPIRCVKEMGANTVIAVNLNANFFPMSEKDIKSSSQVALVTSRIMLNKLASYMAADADVLIEPKILKQDIKISPSYFLKFVKEREIIKAGEEETLKAIPKIIELINQ